MTLGGSVCDTGINRSITLLYEGCEIGSMSPGKEMKIGIDDFEAMRSPTGKYRTTPLRGLFSKMKGGFYHDGRFAELPDVIDHYNKHLSLNISASEKQDLVEYLKSL